MFASPVVNFFSQVPLHLTEELQKKPKGAKNKWNTYTNIYSIWDLDSLNTTLSLVINIDLSFEAYFSSGLAD